MRARSPEYRAPARKQTGAPPFKHQTTTNTHLSPVQWCSVHWGEAGASATGKAHRTEQWKGTELKKDQHCKIFFPRDRSANSMLAKQKGNTDPLIYGFLSHLKISWIQCKVIYIYLHAKYISRMCCCLVTKLCPTLLPTMNCRPQDSSVHRVSQARILEWVAISFSKGSSLPGDQTHISCTGRWVLYHWATKKAPRIYIWI